MTPARLRDLAAREDAAALRALDDGDAPAARDYRILAQLHREVAAAMEKQGLPSLPTESTVERPMMTDEHRAKLSASRGLVDNPAMKAARKAGYPSVRAVAKALKEDPGFISKCLRGVRPMPPRIAEAFEKLTDFPASRWR